MYSHSEHSHLKQFTIILSTIMFIQYYLPYAMDTVSSLALYGSAVVKASSFATLTWKYPGCLGSGRVTLLLLSIATTSDMLGLSVAFSCTHNNAMLMHLIISSVQPLAAIDASTSANHLRSPHKCHACEKFMMDYVIVDVASYSASKRKSLHT